MTTLETITADMEDSIIEDINSTPMRRAGVWGIFQRLAGSIAASSRETVSAVRDDDFPAAIRLALRAMAFIVLWLALAAVVVLAGALALTVVVSVAVMWLFFVVPLKLISRG